MSNEVRNLKAGDVVKHFKRETLSPEELRNNPTMYMYKIISMNVKHTETGEALVVYQALYGSGDIWVRPLNIFLENIEKDGKIIKRFELIK